MKSDLLVSFDMTTISNWPNHIPLNIGMNKEKWVNLTHTLLYFIDYN